MIVHCIAIEIALLFPIHRDNLKRENETEGLEDLRWDVLRRKLF